MWSKIYNWLDSLSGKGLSTLIIVVVVVCVIGLGYGMWQLKRWFNYSWGYESQVTSTVCEMVKPEYLKNPSRCK